MRMLVPPFASKPFSTVKLRFVTNRLLIRGFNTENHEFGARFQRGEAESLPKILFGWLCLPSFPLAGERCVVFQRGLYETCLHRTAADQNLCEAVGAGIDSVGGRAHDVDHYFPALPCTVGRGG